MHLTGFPVQKKNQKNSSEDRYFRPKSILAPIFILLIGSLGAGRCNLDQAGGGIENQTCLACHDGFSGPDVSHFVQGPHKDLSCESCHGDGYLHVRNGGRGGSFIENPGKLSFAAQSQFCGECHEAIVDGFEQTPHGALEAVGCNDCHNVHEPLGLAVASSKPTSLDIPGYSAMCAECHETQDAQFALSGHALADVATCGSCHNVHTPGMFQKEPLDNTLCLQCHGSFELGFDTQEAIDAHTGDFHPVDPAGSGASRCISCHLPPSEFEGQPNVAHDHTLFTVPPIASNEAADNGDPILPNSCSGVMGCHDSGQPGAGSIHDVTDQDQNTALQALYESIGAI